MVKDKVLYLFKIILKNSSSLPIDDGDTNKIANM
jgi:hypothetical protein